ncbi:CBO0543 family protein [Salirhabdus salicampi]|uniref:CBO0543 family protein n=1 Tax=Salirhabdus salicampi TaxID=476102 RepID=UPI0020C40557|nr:CBO0543 family protein [Salirhabdus salicampi]MCP8615390.1 hypothetical protein [Salirhabdus salicampi]
MTIKISEEIKDSPSHEHIEKIKEILLQLEYNDWLQNVLFTWQWWFLLTATIMPWIIWWKLVDKARLLEIVTYGLWWILVAVTLDDIGVTLQLWDYPKQLMFLIHPLGPSDLTVIPVTYMLLYQYTSRWTSFVIGSFVVAFVFAFVFEPLFIKFEMLKFHDTVIKWKHWYSFVLFGVIAIVIRKFHLLIVDYVKEDNNTINK